jgi:hypothetical protein
MSDCDNKTSASQYRGKWISGASGTMVGDTASKECGTNGRIASITCKAKWRWSGITNAKFLGKVSAGDDEDVAMWRYESISFRSVV